MHQNKNILFYINYSVFTFNYTSLVNFQGILEFFTSILPYLYSITMIISNISLVVGGITFLLDTREENGKEMIFRSLIVLLIFFFIFRDHQINYGNLNNEISDIVTLGSFIVTYLLFSLIALSLIMLVVNFGLYMMNPTQKSVKGIKKSVICIFAVLLPLGFNFPVLPSLG